MKNLFFPDHFLRKSPDYEIIHFILRQGLSILVKYLLEKGANPRTKGCLSLSLELYHRNVFLTLIETEAGNYEVRNLLITRISVAPKVPLYSRLDTGCIATLV